MNRYSVFIINRTKEEIIGKVITMPDILNPKANVEILYIKRKSGGRGFIGVSEELLKTTWQTVISMC